MNRKRLPNLPDTGRRYVEGTRRARLASPGVERFVPARRRGAWPAVAAAVLAVALVGAMLILGR
jgi:hypothetical protein